MAKTLTVSDFHQNVKILMVFFSNCRLSNIFLFWSLKSRISTYLNSTILWFWGSKIVRWAQSGSVKIYFPASFSQSLLLCSRGSPIGLLKAKYFPYVRGLFYGSIRASYVQIRNDNLFHRIWVCCSLLTTHLLPDRPFYNFRALKSVTRHSWTTRNLKISWFWGPETDKRAGRVAMSCGRSGIMQLYLYLE